MTLIIPYFLYLSLHIVPGMCPLQHLSFRFCDHKRSSLWLPNIYPLASCFLRTTNRNSSIVLLNHRSNPWGRVGVIHPYCALNNWRLHATTCTAYKRFASHCSQTSQTMWGPILFASTTVHTVLLCMIIRETVRSNKGHTIHLPPSIELTVRYLLSTPTSYLPPPLSTPPLSYLPHLLSYLPHLLSYLPHLLSYHPHLLSYLPPPPILSTTSYPIYPHLLSYLPPPPILSTPTSLSYLPHLLSYLPPPPILTPYTSPLSTPNPCPISCPILSYLPPTPVLKLTFINYVWGRGKQKLPLLIIYCDLLPPLTMVTFHNTFYAQLHWYNPPLFDKHHCHRGASLGQGKQNNNIQKVKYGHYEESQMSLLRMAHFKLICMHRVLWDYYRIATLDQPDVACDVWC